MKNHSRMDVENLWNHVLNHGYTVRKNGLNGLEEWQPLKNLYSTYEIGTTKNVPINEKIKGLVQKVNYACQDKDHNDVTIEICDIKLTNSKETDHFIIQHLRIPTMLDFTLPLVKILQIAYNAGQVKAEIEKDTYHQKIVKFYEENKLSDLTTFVKSN